MNFEQSKRSQHAVPISDDFHVDQIKVGDFNGDGRLDVVFSEIHKDLGTTPAPFIFMLGDGTGKLADVSTTLFGTGLQYGNFVARMEIGDFNGDGVDDVFGVDNGEDKMPFSGGFNELFLSNGKGGMTNASALLPQVKINSHGAALGDVNNDGRLDVLVNALMSDGNRLWIQRSDGKFVESPGMLPDLIIQASWNSYYFYPRTNTYSNLIDLNRDGYLDMILGTWHQNPKGSEVYLNSGGSFANSPPIKLPSSGVQDEAILDVEPIDLNGDDLPDLVLSVTDGLDANYYEVRKIQLLVNQGAGKFTDETASRLNFSAPNEFNSWYKSIEVVDMNKDGAMDLVGLGYGRPEIFMNDGSGKFERTLERKTDYGTSAVGDFDSDGLPDLVMAMNNLFVDVLLNKSENWHVYKSNFGGESLIGSAGDDKFIHIDGHSKFFGNGGLDVAHLPDNRSAYKVSVNKNHTSVTKNGAIPDKIDLTDINRIKFSDYSIATDISGNAGKTAKILGAVFGKAEVSNKAYAGIGLNLLDSGLTYESLMQLALDTKIGSGASNTAVVELLWKNLVGAAPSTTDIAPFVQDLESGRITRSGLAVYAAELDLNAQNIDLIGISTAGLAYTPVG